MLYYGFDFKKKRNHLHFFENIYSNAVVSLIPCDDRMGGGWGICLHRTRGSGRGQPDAHAASPWIQVRDLSELGLCTYKIWTYIQYLTEDLIALV